ncbi:cytochrome P450 [Cristinia sonorae]|uniref:Cytochrome P450 n=1 Tax=Cristinia sonorae TaxID=1940300 RepID=A0A8K0XR10_9AGAR|nr:cytochrome P450 [Cristinia sonorae]
MGIPLQIAAVGALSYLLWRVVKARSTPSHWKNIPGPKSDSFLAGHFLALKSKDSWAFLENLCSNYGGIVKLQALLGSKFLYVSDPAALYSMFVKEPSSWEETPVFLIGNSLLFGAGIAGSSGETHRKQRKLLTPAFAPSHLRQLTPVFLHVGETLRDAIAAQVRDGPREVNVAAWAGRGALEIVGQGAMGYSFDPLVDAMSNDYGIALRQLLPSVFEVAYHWAFVPLSVYLGPPKFRRWLLNRYPYRKVQHLKNVVDTVWNKSIDIVGQRKAALEAGEEAVNAMVGGGKDIMSILLRANMEASDEDRIPDEQLIAQVNTIVFAASDTTSNSLARILYTLVEHPEAQARLREEIIEFRESGDELTYERLVELPYLHAVCCETFRVYPTVLSMDREAQNDTVLPLSQPITDNHGNTINSVPIRKGDKVAIGIHGFNRSKAVWGDDALEWKPERWLKSENSAPYAKGALSGGAFYNLMTFAGGPRSCIGFKYAELEIKTFLFYLIGSFTFKAGTGKIIWNSSFTVFPSIDKDSMKAEMPLLVELIR